MNARRRQFTLALVSVIGVFAGCEPPAKAQDYPARPVKIIVPYPASGLGMDMMARVVAQKLSEQIGRPHQLTDLPRAARMPAPASEIDNRLRVQLAPKL